VVKKRGRRYVVLSATTGRVLGTYATKAGAERRLRQIETFKHMRRRAAVSRRGRRR
jgi:hypothetical protein